MGLCECGSKPKIKQSNFQEQQRDNQNQNKIPSFSPIYPNMEATKIIEEYEIDPYSVLNISQSSDSTAI